MIRLSRAQVHPIGLDIGHDSVKMIQLERVGDHLSVYAAARAPLPWEARDKPHLRLPLAFGVVAQLFKQHSFRGRAVVVALPREIVHVRNLRFSRMPADDLAAAARAEAAKSFPFDLADAQVQLIPVGEVRQGAETRQEVIVVAVPNSGTAEFVEIARRSGVVLDALDVEACALFRTADRFVRRRDDGQLVHVLVDVGVERSLLVIGRGREINVIKPIHIGGRHFQEAVGRKLGITTEEAQALRRRLISPVETTSSPDERDPVRKAASDAVRSVMDELAGEISLCLRYHSVTFRGQRPAVVKLVGGEATDGQLLAIVRSALSTPVEVGRPLYSVDTRRMSADDRSGPMSEWATAFGLALKRVAGTFGPRDGRQRDPEASDATGDAGGADGADAANERALVTEGAGA